MAKRPPVFRSKAQGSRAEAVQAYDRDRGSARDRGYTAEWAKASKRHLKQHPLCAYCHLNDDIVTAATLTDHLYPQRRYPGVFWRREWWVSSCDRCHSGFKQTIEGQGRAALDQLADRLGRPMMNGPG